MSPPALLFAIHACFAAFWSLWVDGVLLGESLLWLRVTSVGAGWQALWTITSTALLTCTEESWFPVAQLAYLSSFVGFARGRCTAVIGMWNTQCTEIACADGAYVLGGGDLVTLIALPFHIVSEGSSGGLVG